MIPIMYTFFNNTTCVYSDDGTISVVSSLSIRFGKCHPDSVINYTVSEKTQFNFVK